MRVLFVTTSWGSHYYHLVPLIWALRSQGHEALVSCEPSFADTVVRSGVTPVPFTEDADRAEVMRRVRENPPEWPEEAPSGVTQEEWVSTWRDVSRKSFPMFVGLAEEFTDDLLFQVRKLRPDLIIYEPTSYVAPMVAAAEGVSALRHVLGLDVVYMARNLVRPLLEPLAERLGVEDVDPLGRATIDNCPPSMQLASEVERIQVRFVPYNGSGELPRWLFGPSERRRVCISWGLCASGRGRAFLVPQLIEACAGIDAEVVVTLAKEDRYKVGDLPSNVRVLESLPLNLLLPSCDAIVHQGGMGTTLTALTHGVPQLVVPQMPDEVMEARSFVSTGAGISIPSVDGNPETFHGLITDVLKDATYRDAAVAVQQEMRDQPTPARVVDELKEFTPSP